MDASQLDFLGNYKFLLPQLIIFICCLYFYFKVNSFDAILLSIGSGLSLCILMVHLFILPYTWSFLEKLREVYYLETVLSISNLLSSICFIAGFLMLILKHIELKNGNIEGNIKSIQ